MGIELINNIRKVKKMTILELAEKSGVPVGTLNKIISGSTQDPKFETLKALANILEFKLDDLNDTENKLEVQSFRADETYLLDLYNQLSKDGRKSITSVAESMINFEVSKKEVIPTRSLPLFIAPSAAGIPAPIFNDDFIMMDVDDSVPLRADLGIRLIGDSMEPRYANGSIVWVKKQPTLENGEIGVFILNNESVCKKFHCQNNKCHLLSINHNYAPIEISEYDTLITVGRVLN